MKDYSVVKSEIEEHSLNAWEKYSALGEYNFESFGRFLLAVLRNEFSDTLIDKDGEQGRILIREVGVADFNDSDKIEVVITFVPKRLHVMDSTDSIYLDLSEPD